MTNHYKYIGGVFVLRFRGRRPPRGTRWRLSSGNWSIRNPPLTPISLACGKKWRGHPDRSCLRTGKARQRTYPGAGAQAELYTLGKRIFTPIMWTGATLFEDALGKPRRGFRGKRGQRVPIFCLEHGDKIQFRRALCGKRAARRATPWVASAMFWATKSMAFCGDCLLHSGQRNARISRKAIRERLYRSVPSSAFHTAR